MVTRYNECMSRWEEGQPDMRIDQNGDYVKYSDYADLAERCEKMKLALRGLHREIEALIEDETLGEEAINHPSMIAARSALSEDNKDKE